MKQFFLLSHDARFDALSEHLRFLSYPVFREEPSSFPAESVAVFPLGAGEDDILPVIKKAPRGSVAAVGRKTELLQRYCEENGILLFPLLENKRYLSQNAAATAEGFLAECIQKTDTTLSDLTVLVIGYGNCGKEIAKLLYLCGAELWIHSRQGSMAKADEDGFSVLFALDEKLKMFDCVVNTVPSAIFDHGFFSRMRKGARFFQIATGLSGLDPALAKKEGISFYPLPALPAKYSPVTEGENLFAALDSILKLSNLPERE